MIRETEFIHHTRRPVRRAKAEQYLLFTLLGFAGSVVFTRVFLELTGYPQVGNRELHIAHVLWGGLLLFVATLVPLIFANRMWYVVSSIVGGIGVGLFIDEVGKFITKSNDYFYPAAAPIIYAFFLITVLLYLQVARRKLSDPRAEMYAALDELQDVIDNPLDPHERAELEQRLEHIVSHKERPDLVQLAQALLDFLASDEFTLRQHKLTLWERFATWGNQEEARWLTQWGYRIILIAGLLLVSVPALLDSIDTLQTIFGSSPTRQSYLADLIDNAVVSSPNELTWLVILVVLEGLVAIPLIAGAILLMLRREARGIEIAGLGLLMSLTLVNLLVFYFNQFLSLTSTLSQFAVLMMVLHYRKRFLPRPLPKPKPLIT